MNTASLTAHSDTISRILLHFQFPVHRIGYKQLCCAISRFAQDPTQSLSKDLYPYIAEQMGYPDWRAIETAIRGVIADAWRNGNREAWTYYFPGLTCAPSNKRFIATLAEYIQ